jgi:hypothetical protein
VVGVVDDLEEGLGLDGRDGALLDGPAVAEDALALDPVAVLALELW